MEDTRRAAVQPERSSSSRGACWREAIRSYTFRVLRLTLLAVELIEAILGGRQPEGMILPARMEPLPAESEGQKTALIC